MLNEWKNPIDSNQLMWSMLERVDSDGSGWVSISELRQFERSVVDKAVLSATVVAYMFYPTCCKAAFLLISCRDNLKDGAYEWYLNEDLDQPCYVGSHLASVLMIGIPILVVWVIGMPVFIFIVLESHRKSKHNDKVRFRFGMLMEGYEDEYFYWESVIASRKMLIIGVSIFMSSYKVDIQAFVGINIVVLFMCMHISSNPYNSATLDSMEKYALGTAFLTLNCGLFLFLIHDPTKETDSSDVIIAISCFIVGINVLYLAYALHEILLYYASHKPGAAKKIMSCCIPITNVLCCRSKKARKKAHLLLHKTNINVFALNKKKTSMKVFPLNKKK